MMNPYINWRKTIFNICLGMMLMGGEAIAQTLPLAENLIRFNSPDGETFLIESRSRLDYLPLSIQFETQENQAFCGVASMVMVLNALGIEAPAAENYGRNYFTQDNIFNSKTDEVIRKRTIARQGMTVQEVGEFLARYPVETQIYHGSEVSLDEFRQLLINNLQQPDNFIIINYLRRAIAQESGGHISPIAAYHRQSDRFLILDVARYKYPPVWVSAEELWKSIRTVDSVSRKTRGFVLVNRLPQP